eukprot:CAMPEP_0176297160 /NCGR_PEP_ID=MMETSP0121_2-20121125/58572_1 /TAXON_ID=160619 /ORGANISM="Kryptoperidinium foliaceum, Strain CCMP 1326" /LENGTH=34 /DNA_ID= /DNA_START= /DNA_END= /DNA_ORIENTATION=
MRHRAQLPSRREPGEQRAVGQQLLESGPRARSDG